MFRFPLRYLLVALLFTAVFSAAGVRLLLIEREFSETISSIYLLRKGVSRDYVNEHLFQGKKPKTKISRGSRFPMETWIVGLSHDITMVYGIQNGEVLLQAAFVDSKVINFDY